MPGCDLLQRGMPMQRRILSKKTKTGRPAGDEAFVQSLETLVGRELHLKNTGRPRLKLNRDYVPGITC